LGKPIAEWGMLERPLIRTARPRHPDISVVRHLDALFDRALLQRASDLHFEPYAEGLRVRARIDGLLHEMAVHELSLRDAMITRLKVLARMDIGERRLPQDGRMRISHQNQAIDLRVSALPTVEGEKLVVRLQPIDTEPPQLSDLGMLPNDLACLKRVLHNGQGLVLATGPTGSGKTRTLYACLHALHHPQVNLTTVEDPVEIQFPGIHQVSVNERAGLGFANTLRALLRQDPDVLMVGEIRDLETAQIALQGGQTGHLVLSSVHTNDAPSTLLRLLHMGLPAYQVAASVRLIIAQRLLRRLCEHCKTPQPTPPTGSGEELPVHLGACAIYQPVGCAHCRQGYRGRVGVFSLLLVSPGLQDALLQNPSLQALTQQAAREGMPTLRQAAWAQVAAGQTSVAEVLLQTPDDEGPGHGGV